MRDYNNTGKICNSRGGIVMSSFKDAYLTDMGAELLAKTISEGAQLEFVKMVIGDGAYEEEEKSKDALKRRTELKSQKQEFAFASVSSSGEGAIKLKALINNKNVTEGYRITEIGIIAKIKGDTTTAGELYSVAVAEEADYLPAESTPITYIQEYYTKISNAESVTINIEAGEYALAEDMMEVRFPVYEESAELSALESGEQVETKWGKVSKAINSLIEHIVSKASTTAFGHVKLSDSSAVTDSTGLALPVTEKNASIEGTMAHDIATLNTDLAANYHWKTYGRVTDIGLTLTCTMDDILVALYKKGNFSMLCTPLWKDSCPNIDFATSSNRHILTVKVAESGYVLVSDFDVNTGIEYVRGHDGYNYTAWSSTAAVP